MNRTVASCLVSTCSCQVFKCGSLASCPGGTPGTCAPGLSGTPCSRCAEGATWVGTACETCGGWREALWDAWRSIVFNDSGPHFHFVYSSFGLVIHSFSAVSPPKIFFGNLAKQRLRHVSKEFLFQVVSIVCHWKF